MSLSEASSGSISNSARTSSLADVFTSEPLTKFYSEQWRCWPNGCFLFNRLGIAEKPRDGVGVRNIAKETFDDVEPRTRDHSIRSVPLICALYLGPSRGACSNLL